MIKESPFAGRKFLRFSKSLVGSTFDKAMEYEVKCMEGVNAGKRGPCPDPSKQNKPKGKRGSGGGTGGGGGQNSSIPARVVQRERAKQEQYTGFLKGEYESNRTQLHNLSQAHREGKLSTEEYSRAMQDYERSRQQYVSRLGMSGLKKLGIALGVTAAAVGTAYLGYRYAPAIKATAVKLDDFLTTGGGEDAAVKAKKAAVYATALLGGITITQEALKGNNAVDPTANTAKRVVEILMAPVPEKESKDDAIFRASLSALAKGKGKTADEAAEYLYKRKYETGIKIADGGFSKEQIQAAIDQGGDATLEPEDIIDYYREHNEQEKQDKPAGLKITPYEQISYSRAAQLGSYMARQSNREKERESGKPHRIAVIEALIKSKHPLPGKETFLQINGKSKNSRTPEERDFIAAYPDRVARSIAGDTHTHKGRLSSIDPAVVAEGLAAAHGEGYGALLYEDFISDVKDWESGSRH